MAKRITQNVLRKFHILLKNHVKNSSRPKNILFTTSLTLMLPNLSQQIFSQVICQPKLNVEDDLRRACSEGETAIVDLMNELRNLVIETSKEYRKLLQKQIDITQRAVVSGPAAFDELPKYRLFADELCSELNEYLILLKTIGEVAYDQTLISAVMNDTVNEKNLDFILKKYQELEIFLLKEFEENKRKELELLENKLVSIEYNKL